MALRKSFVGCAMLLCLLATPAVAQEDAVDGLIGRIVGSAASVQLSTKTDHRDLTKL